MLAVAPVCRIVHERRQPEQGLQRGWWGKKSHQQTTNINNSNICFDPDYLFMTSMLLLVQLTIVSILQSSTQLTSQINGPWYLSFFFFFFTQATVLSWLTTLLISVYASGVKGVEVGDPLIVLNNFQFLLLLSVVVPCSERAEVKVSKWLSLSVSACDSLIACVKYHTWSRKLMSGQWL